MDVTKVLGHKHTADIWIELIRKPEQSVSELANSLGIAQSSVTDQIKILEKTKLVKTKYESGTKGVAKICSPTYRGLFEQIAKELGMKNITDQDYQDIDDVLLDSKIKSKWIKISEKVADKSVLTMIVQSMVLVFNPETFKEFKKTVKDRKLKIKMNRGFKKFGDKLMKSSFL